MGLEEIKAGNMTDEGEGWTQRFGLSDLIAALHEEISSSQILKFKLGFKLCERIFNGLKRKLSLHIHQA